MYKYSEIFWHYMLLCAMNLCRSSAYIRVDRSSGNFYPVPIFLKKQIIMIVLIMLIINIVCALIERHDICMYCIYHSYICPLSYLTIIRRRRNEYRWVNKNRDEVKVFIYHLLTETEGNSVFCGPETVDVRHRRSRVHKTHCFPELLK